MRGEIIIDPREQEKDIRSIKAFFKRHNVPHSVQTLDSGDFMFLGRRGEEKVVIRVERKKVHDACSSIRSNRLAAQIAKMLEEGTDIPYIVLEGRVRMNWEGYLETLRVKRGKPFWQRVLVGTRFVYYAEVMNFLTTATEQAGVRLIKTEGIDETCAQLKCLWARWQKPVHTGLGIEEIGDHVPIGIHGKVAQRTYAHWAARGLAGVGGMLTLKVVKKFKTAEGMWGASKDEWMKLLGPVRGERAYWQIRGKMQ